MWLLLVYFYCPPPQRISHWNNTGTTLALVCIWTWYNYRRRHPQKYMRRDAASVWNGDGRARGGKHGGVDPSGLPLPCVPGDLPGAGDVAVQPHLLQALLLGDGGQGQSVLPAVSQAGVHMGTNQWQEQDAGQWWAVAAGAGWVPHAVPTQAQWTGGGGGWKQLSDWQCFSFNNEWLPNGFCLLVQLGWECFEVIMGSQSTL